MKTTEILGLTSFSHPCSAHAGRAKRDNLARIARTGPECHQALVLFETRRQSSRRAPKNRRRSQRSSRRRRSRSAARRSAASRRLPDRRSARSGDVPEANGRALAAARGLEFAILRAVQMVTSPFEQLSSVTRATASTARSKASAFSLRRLLHAAHLADVLHRGGRGPRRGS